MFKKIFLILFCIIPNILASLEPNLNIESDWDTGYQVNLILKNIGNEAISNWSFILKLPLGQTIGNFWNGKFDRDGTSIKITPAEYNRTIDPNNSVSIGFIVNNPQKNADRLAIGNVQEANEKLAAKEPGAKLTAEEEMKAEKAEPASAGPGPSTEKSSVSIGKFKMVAYFPNWFLYPKNNREKFEPKDIDGNLLTHIIYAFAKPYTTDKDKKIINYKISFTDPWADIEHGQTWGSNEKYWGNFKQLKDLKKRYPHLKTLIAVGGWSIFGDSGFPAAKFSTLAASEQLMQDFILSLLEFCASYDFDGVDFDWEFPGFIEHGGRSGDKVNFTKLLKETHEAFNNSELLQKIYGSLNKKAPEKLILTAAVSAAPRHIQNIEVNKIIPYLDWINLMTYDYFGAWSPNSDDVTNHNAPLFPSKFGDKNFNLDATVKNYLSLGVPKNKLVVGLPLYGRSFAGVGQTKSGLFNRYSAAGPGTDDGEPGMVLLGDILKRFGDLTYQVDPLAQVPYLYDKEKRVFISFDDIKSLTNKAEYIKQNNLGGAMFWCLAKENAVWDAIRAVYNVLKTQ